MPWKPAATAGNSHRPRVSPKSIRGQISGPIPIPDPMDEEFHMREHAAMVTAGGDGTSNEPVLVFQDAASSNQSQQMTRFTTGSSSNIDPLIQHQQSDALVSIPPPDSIVTQSSGTRRHQYTHLSNQENDRRNSTAGKPQRKKSTLKSAFSKLFGRKKKVDAKDKGRLSGQNASEATSHSPSKQHRSDPTWERSNQKSVEPNRSFSMPITEYDRALRSHSIGPDDVLAIQSARNSMNTDVRLSGKHSVPYEPPTHPASPRWAGGSKLAGLSPRPASSQDRGTRMAGLSDDPSEIGRAISSDARGLKRRSRSLSVMPSLELASQGVVRRRSAEIRYWRESYVAPFMSPTSTTANDEIEDLLSGEVKEEEELTLSAENRPATPDETILVEPAEPRVKTPTDTAKTTDPSVSVERVSLDSRVSSLETRMSRLEGIVLQLGQSIPALRQPSNTQTRGPGGGPRQVQLQTPEHIIHSMQLQPGDFGLQDEPRQSTSRPSTRHSDASKMTFGDIDEATPRATILSPADGEIRPAFLAAPPHGVDLTPKVRHGSVTFEHYTNLIALLETERSAREALEAQVRSLGRQIQLMSKSMAYTNTESESPSIDRSLGEVSVFDHDDDDEERRRLTATRFGYNTLGLEDSGIATDNRSEDEFTESFVTPVEMGKNDFDMYGNENDPMLSSGRKLSLSHITMRQPLTAMQQGVTKAV